MVELEKNKTKQNTEGLTQDLKPISVQSLHHHHHTNQQKQLLNPLIDEFEYQHNLPDLPLNTLKS